MATVYEEINSMVKEAMSKKAGLGSWLKNTYVDFLTGVFRNQYLDWRKKNGLPEYPFTGSNNVKSTRGAANAVTNAYTRSGDTPFAPKVMHNGQVVDKRQ